MEGSTANDHDDADSNNDTTNNDCISIIGQRTGVDDDTNDNTTTSATQFDNNNNTPHQSLLLLTTTGRNHQHRDNNIIHHRRRPVPNNNDVGHLHDENDDENDKYNDNNSMMMVRDSSNSSQGAVVVFTASLVRQLESPTIRLPPNYVGVRKVRPSNNNIVMMGGYSTNNMAKTTAATTTTTRIITKNDDNAGVDGENNKDNIKSKKPSTIKFVVNDENGNERRMTSSEKRARKIQLAMERKEYNRKAKLMSAAAASVKPTQHESSTGLDDQHNDRGNDRKGVQEDEEETDDAIVGENTQHHQHQYHRENNDDDDDDENSNPTSTYHQLPLNPTAVEQELAELRGERSGIPPVILSPAMALQFYSNMTTMITARDSNGLVSSTTTTPTTATKIVPKGGSAKDNNIKDGTHTDDCSATHITTPTTATLVYDHTLSQQWAEMLQTDCIYPAEEVRQSEDLRQLAYRLHPEPWQRLRPTLRENPLTTTYRPRFLPILSANNNDIMKNNIIYDDSHNTDDVDSNNLVEVTESTTITTTTTSNDRPETDHIGSIHEESSFHLPTSCEWVSTVCRPAIASGLSSSSCFEMKNSAYAHDATVSLVFEYIHKETPYYVSCGAKFGTDFLIYDGPRDERHAFAGLKVLSATTTSTSTTTMMAASPTKTGRNDPPRPTTLPLPTAYSLTSFVRCLNTAGKVALLATAIPVVEDVMNDDDTKNAGGDNDGNNSSNERLSSSPKHKTYKVLFVDVALEKVLDAPTHKRRRGGGAGAGGPSSKKNSGITKRRDVTQNLAKVK